MSDAFSPAAALDRARVLVSRPWWSERLRRAWSMPELRWLGAILVLAAVLRIVWVVYAAREPQGIHDPIFYFAYGRSIADGFGYALPDGSTAYYPIGYPAALAGVFALVKHTPIPTNLVFTAASFQIFLSVATVALAFELGRRLFSPTVGLVAALWLALFPNLIFHTATYLTETLFIFLVMSALVVLLSVDWRERRLGWGRLLVFGALLGLSALVRPISLLFLPLLPVVWLVAGFGGRRSFGYAGVVLVVTAAVIAPWAIRNAVVLRAPIIISTNLGDNLCMGHHPGATGHFALPAHCFAEEPYVGLGREEFEVRRNNDNTRKAIEFALENPRTELKLLSRKAYHIWRHDHDGLRAVESYGDDLFIDPGLRTALERVADVFFFVTISLGGLGLIAFARPPWDGRRLFFLLALLALAGVPLVFFGDARFHVPASPLLAISAAWFVVALRKVARLARPASAAVEGTEGERPVAEQDALQDA
ncbi:MAG: glycosyltransferase family 39 protein [Chloroflexi bacterium]|nr:glycosyltransferase family 39 protein [Chloroflexota bacterium]